MELAREAFDSNADERRQRFFFRAARDFLRRELDVIVFFRIRARAVTVFEVDPKIFDGLTLELREHARVHGLRQIRAHRRGLCERLRILRACVASAFFASPPSLCAVSCENR